MSERLSTLCYLTFDQLGMPVDLESLTPLVSAGTAQLVGNAYVPSIDQSQGVLDGEQLVRSLLEKADQPWEPNTIWEPSGKDWITETEAAYDLVVLFAARDKAKYSLPVDWSVLRVIEKPFLVVNPGQKRRKRDKVLAAIDVANKKQQNLNDHILATAALMASIYEAELHIITAVQVSQVAADLDLVDPVKQETAFLKKHMHHLEQLAAKHKALPGHVRVQTGVPSDVIRKQAKKLDVIMTVVGTERRSGLSGLLFGNTVETILGQSPNNVLVVPRSG